LRGTCEFSKGIAGENRAGDFLAIEIAGVRKDGSYAGAEIVATEDGGVADFDAGNIGDGIERASWQDTDF